MALPATLTHSPLWRWRPALLAALALAALAALPGILLVGRQPAPPPPSLTELLAVLQRPGAGAAGVSLQVTYAPRILFQASGQPLPGPGLVFFVEESVHQGALPETFAPPRLSVDGGQPQEPIEVVPTLQDPHHRTTRVRFAPSDPARTLRLIFPAGSDIVWRLPLSLPGADRPQPGQPSLAAAVPSGPSLSAMSRTLRRERPGLRYGGQGPVDLAVTLVTPEYLAAALPASTAQRFDPLTAVVFLVTETSHDRELPAQPPAVQLDLRDQRLLPARSETRAASPHHRVTLLRFETPPPGVNEAATLALLLPDGPPLTWQLPLSYGSDRRLPLVGLTGASALAMLGGLLAAMWPCLFQLTVFFIPTLAGVGLHQDGQAAGQPRRREVLRAALLFVLGFTLVYTLAGAAVGLAAQHVGTAVDFERWQRWLGVGGGIVVFLLALRVAVRARAPLVCRMPVVSHLGQADGRRPGPLELMLAGLAFATGCMTCFGAALVLTMAIYVGMSGSMALGALIMFLFSLGMGLPLVLAAMAMARLLPLLFRLERALPWMGLTSSLLMMGFAGLLVSGRYMALSQWLSRSLGAAWLP